MKELATELPLWPVVGRELRRLVRRPLTRRVRSGAVLASVVVAGGVIGLHGSAGGAPVTLGRDLFVPLALLSFGFSLFTGPLLTADALSEERRAGTLSLLFLANLNGYQVAAGKLLALALPALHCVLAQLPILATAFFLGGVTGAEFFRTAVLLAATLQLSLAAGMLASACNTDGRRALAGAFVGLLGWTLALPGLSILVAGGLPVRGAPWLWGSPAYAAWRVPEVSYRAGGGDFWIGVLVLNLAAWVGFGLAGWILTRSWQDRPDAAGPNAGARRRRMSAARRERLLAANPVFWLAERGSPGNAGIWWFLAGTLGIWLGGAYGLHQKWVNAISVFFMMYVLHVVLKLWLGWEAGRRFAEDRHSGALELLLCTPLREYELTHGWLRYLRRRFLAPVLGLVLVDWSLFHLGMDQTGWWGQTEAWGFSALAGMGLFLSDSYALAWVGLSQGLTSPTPMRATLNTLGYVLLAPFLVCMALFAFVGWLAAGAGLPLAAFTAVWFGIGYLTDAVLCARSMTMLEERFRSAAEAGDGGGGGPAAVPPHSAAGVTSPR